MSAGYLLLGSVARPFPEPGCGCPACADRPPETESPGIALQVAGVRLDLAGAHPHLAPGQTRVDAGIRLLALPRPGPGVAVVAGLGGRAVLWAPGPGPLGDLAVEGLAGAGLDGAVLDLRGADGRPDPLALAHQVALLRRAGALSPGADLVAVGLGHDTGDPVRLARRLARWAVRLAAAGAPIAEPAGRPSRAAAVPPRRTLVLGPAASGKSGLAEDLLAAEPDVVYAAPGPAPGTADPDWAARVARHRDRRPGWWSTVEDADLPALLGRGGPPVLVDSLGTWVARALDRSGAWDDVPGWPDRYDAEVDSMVRAWRAGARRVVAVAEETGWGVVPETSSGRRFRDALGTLTRRLADQSERVLLVVAGLPVDLGRPDGTGPW